MNKLEIMRRDYTEEWLYDIKQSWTWARLTDEERERFLEHVPTIWALNCYNTTTQVGAALSAYYSGFLHGIGYAPIGWREQETDTENHGNDGR